MNNRSVLVKKLSKDIKRLENEIKQKDICNIRNYALKALVKSGLAIDYALPFIFSVIVLANSQSFKENKPFHIDFVKDKASIETIDTSSGIHLENTSYDLDYDNELIEYSTGWIVNNLGLYERTVTSYRISNDIDLNDTQKILSMSKEEIENMLAVTNIETICQDSLKPEDKIYDSDALIVINHTESEEEFIVRPETVWENIGNSMWYMLNILVCGLGMKAVEKLFVKKSIKDRLKKYEGSLKIINKEELEKMKKILILKQQNLAMLDETLENIDVKSDYSYKLRKL